MAVFTKTATDHSKLDELRKLYIVYYFWTSWYTLNYYIICKSCLFYSALVKKAYKHTDVKLHKYLSKTILLLFHNMLFQQVQQQKKKKKK